MLFNCVVIDIARIGTRVAPHLRPSTHWFINLSIISPVAHSCRRCWGRWHTAAPGGTSAEAAAGVVVPAAVGAADRQTAASYIRYAAQTWSAPEAWL